MSSTACAAAPIGSSTIDEQLRLRIAEELAGSFKGDVIGPDHAAYEQGRQFWNAMIDRRPGLILRCTSTQDVVAAVGAASPPALSGNREFQDPGTSRLTDCGPIRLLTGAPKETSYGTSTPNDGGRLKWQTGQARVRIRLRCLTGDGRAV